VSVKAAAELLASATPAAAPKKAVRKPRLSMLPIPLFEERRR
jgi:hypothetical protein